MDAGGDAVLCATRVASSWQRSGHCRRLADTGRGHVDLGRLREAVARCRTGLAALGVERGDRVVGYLPNIPEAVVAMLATASLGAVWACCPPEFGPTAVTDRLAQIEPKVLITVQGYVYGDKEIDRSAAVAAIRAGLPTVEHVVVVEYLDPNPPPAPTTAWADLLSIPGELAFEQVPFDHPLYVLFSWARADCPKPSSMGTAASCSSM
ncbi:AMP-binding protein [Aeromicrobium sp. UC242_57]|uniref:AMP-binding protein n=1 Tax=Aeromicrobium sp. UC242_57 TaxID=3374624 RepID=UPI00378AF635